MVFLKENFKDYEQLIQNKAQNFIINNVRRCLFKNNHL